MPTTPDFLSEGAKTYVDALAAIKAYERMVCGICKKVYDKHKAELVNRIGLMDAQCLDHENKQPENVFAELGVKQRSSSGRETLYVYLRWDGTKGLAPEISAEVCLEFSKKGDRNEYARHLREVPFIQPTDDSELWSSRELSDLSSCREVLDELLSGWLTCWPAGRRLK